MPPQTRKFLFGLVAAALPLIPVLSFFFDWRIAAGRHTWIATGLFTFGGLFCLSNFYYSFLRVPLLVWRGVAPDAIRNVSSFPLLGVFVLPGLVLAPPSFALSVATLLLMLVDTGSISWFVAIMWNDDGAWGDWEKKVNDAVDGR